MSLVPPAARVGRLLALGACSACWKPELVSGELDLVVQTEPIPYNVAFLHRLVTCTGDTLGTCSTVSLGAECSAARLCEEPQYAGMKTVLELPRLAAHAGIRLDDDYVLTVKHGANLLHDPPQIVLGLSQTAIEEGTRPILDVELRTTGVVGGDDWALYQITSNAPKATELTWSTAALEPGTSLESRGHALHGIATTSVGKILGEPCIAMHGNIKTTLDSFPGASGSGVWVEDQWVGMVIKVFGEKVVDDRRCCRPEHVAETDTCSANADPSTTVIMPVEKFLASDELATWCEQMPEDEALPRFCPSSPAP